jgi:RHS repeat-associated protein
LKTGCDFTANESSQPVLDKRYLFGSGVDQILAQESGNGTVLWALTDQLGTVKDWVNNSGSVANHVVYDAFGRIVSQSNPAFASRYGFTGREFDAETGLYYYRSRYYNPSIGRFIAEDPIGFDAGDANLYRYVGNRPVEFVDPFGLRSNELDALLTIAQPRGSRKNETIYYYPESPNYSIALAAATDWFYLITEQNRNQNTTRGSEWLLGAPLKGGQGKATLRPFGTKNEGNKKEPTINLQPTEVQTAKGKVKVYHETIIDGIPKPASEVKFLYKDEDSFKPTTCPAPYPEQEPILKNDRPFYPLPEPEPAPSINIPWIPELIRKAGEGLGRWIQQRQ